MLTAIALSVVLAIWTAAWFALLGRFWYLRHEFDIRARSPTLVLVSLFTLFIFSSSVLWLWLLRSVGKTLPCIVTFIISYAALSFAATPILIRGIRLVVTYNRVARGRYAQFVKWRPLLGLWVVSTVVYAVRAAFFYGNNPAHYSSDARECFYWDDGVALGAAVLLGAGPLVLLTRRLLKVNDAFKIREEFVRTVGVCSALAGSICIVQVLVIFRLVEDTPQIHIAVEVLVLVFGPNAAVWSLLVPLVSYHKSHRANYLVIPDERDYDEAGKTSAADGVLAIVRKGGEMAVLFETFCREHLCLDSWDFIVCVCKYEMLGSSTADEQFNNFEDIRDQFLLATSPEEINISSSMNKHIVSYSIRERFCSLSDEARRTIFQESVGEVARMLDQNLLVKFRNHVMLKKEKDLAAASRGDKELMELMRASSALSIVESPR